MKKFLKQICGVLLIVTAYFVVGCGASGGGGRQVLPGENPVGPWIGTGGGGGGTGTATETPIVVPTPEEILADGWIDMGYGNYNGAAEKFQRVIESASATQNQIAEGHNGLGWARGKARGLGSGMGEFLQVSNLVEAQIGLALGYLQTAASDGYARACSCFSTAGADNPATVITLPHARELGITNAEIHAAYAYALAMSGNEVAAAAQINAVWNASMPAASTVGQIHSALIALGVSGVNQ